MSHETQANERLFLSGWLKEFGHFVYCRDEAKMIELLLDAELSLPQARELAEKILAAPEKFGYRERRKSVCRS